jgi:6-phosphogluconolactonase
VEIVEPRLFDGAAADEIVSLVADAIEERGGASLVFSGGGTPGGTYRALSRPPRVSAIAWKSVRCYLGDERWVPLDDNQSNAKLVHETLLNHLDEEKPQIFFPNAGKGSAEEGAREYERAIRKAERCEQGMPKFDIVLLGIGEDGHIASIFPNSKLLDESGGKLCMAAERPSGGPRRVTLTPKALLAAAHIVFIVKGENKADIVRRAIEGGEGPRELPARLFADAAERVTWFLDTAAAQALSR